jgi:hypothetical protein
MEHNDQELTCLIMATQEGNVEVGRELLDNSANVELVDWECLPVWGRIGLLGMESTF